MKRELEEQAQNEQRKGVTTSTEYYLAKPGENLNGYTVESGAGMGVYSSVYKCKPSRALLNKDDKTNLDREGKLRHSEDKFY